MRHGTYAVEAAVEAAHWWFVGRRNLFAAEIARVGVAPAARILDVGTSTGTNLRMLRDLQFRDVTGLDFSDDAIRFCAEKGLGDVRKGDICQMPFGDRSFDLILATDIIEHVDDDRRALSEIARVLAPGGRALITVPAFRALWGLQDEVSAHKRRYRREELLEIAESVGLRATRSYYFNYLLFGPIWLARKIIGSGRFGLQSENQLNSNFLNRLLLSIFDFDIKTAPRLQPPFGVSVLAVFESRA